MHVTVVLLRAAGGHKLTADELKAAPRYEGHLGIEPACASLRPRADTPITTLSLFEPRLRHLRGDEFVITGNVVVPGGLVGERWPQAWWCTLLK